MIKLTLILICFLCIYLIIFIGYLLQKIQIQEKKIEENLNELNFYKNSYECLTIQKAKPS